MKALGAILVTIGFLAAMFHYHIAPSEVFNVATRSNEFWIGVYTAETAAILSDLAWMLLGIAVILTDSSRAKPDKPRAAD